MTDTELTKVTDSMGDHWTYHGISVYASRVNGYIVPLLSWRATRPSAAPEWRFPTLDAAVDAIRTHLKEGG